MLESLVLLIQIMVRYLAEHEKEHLVVSMPRRLQQIAEPGNVNENIDAHQEADQYRGLLSSQDDEDGVDEHDKAGLSTVTRFPAAMGVQFKQWPSRDASRHLDIHDPPGLFLLTSKGVLGSGSRVLSETILLVLEPPTTVALELGRLHVAIYAFDRLTCTRKRRNASIGGSEHGSMRPDHTDRRTNSRSSGLFQRSNLSLIKTHSLPTKNIFNDTVLAPEMMGNIQRRVLTAFRVSFCSYTYTRAEVEHMAAFKGGQDVANLGPALFLIDFIIGPLIWGHTSELYGRRILMIDTLGLQQLKTQRGPSQRHPRCHDSSAPQHLWVLTRERTPATHLSIRSLLQGKGYKSPLLRPALP
ncbi:MFS multidrug transporter [Colletotrichum acutatum]